MAPGEGNELEQNIVQPTQNSASSADFTMEQAKVGPVFISNQNILHTKCPVWEHNEPFNYQILLQIG